MSAAAKKTSTTKRILRILTLIVIVVVLFAVYLIFGPNTGDRSHGEFLYIHTNANYDSVLQEVKNKGFVKNIYSFDFLAKRIHYPGRIRPGKYKITQGMSNYAILRMLHAGRQTPVKLVINKLRTEKDLIKKLSTDLEADSATLYQLLHDTTYLSQFGLDTNTVMCAIMPNTYDFLWNTTADHAFRKIETNYARFWGDARAQQAKNIGLTQQQVIIIASIVDEESNKNDEKPNIASVYINRFRKGMKLQADPTVKFAVGDFTIRRITGKYLQIESLYNTYMYEGLPPGPICTPSESSIEAVLNVPQTNYLYFCAKEDFSGYHNFAATYEEQEKNAHLYQQALDARGVH